MKIYVLLFCAVLFLPKNNSNNPVCEKFTFDSCEFNPDEILVGIEMETPQSCQDLCIENNNQCQLFQYNFKQKYCYILSQNLSSYLGTCSKFAGPDLPNYEECLAEAEKNECLKP